MGNNLKNKKLTQNTKQTSQQMDEITNHEYVKTAIQHLKDVFIEEERQHTKLIYLGIFSLIFYIVTLVLCYKYYKRRQRKQDESLIKLDLYFNHGYENKESKQDYYDIYDIDNIV